MMGQTYKVGRFCPKCEVREQSMPNALGSGPRRIGNTPACATRCRSTKTELSSSLEHPPNTA